MCCEISWDVGVHFPIRTLDDPVTKYNVITSLDLGTISVYVYIIISIYHITVYNK